MSRPVELAYRLLGGDEKGWSMDKIRRIIDSGNRMVVRLEKPVPIHVVYLTVYIGPDNSIYFNKDVYGRDDLLEKALFKKAEF